MTDLERDALLLDRAIDELLDGDGAQADEAATQALLAEAEQIVRAVESIPSSSHEAEAWRAMMAAARSPRRRARWLVAIPMAAVLSIGGVAYAARNAAPGDPLWSLRRGAHASRVVLASGAAAKADAWLDRAAGDLALARRLAAERREHAAREALEAFWPDLDAARRAVAALSAAERAPRDARVTALAADAAAFEDALDTREFRDGEGSSSPDDRSGPGSADGDDDARESGDDEIDDHSRSGGGDDAVSSGGDDGSSAGPGEVEKDPEPGSIDDSSSGSGSDDASEIDD